MPTERRGASATAPTAATPAAFAAWAVALTLVLPAPAPAAGPGSAAAADADTPLALRVGQTVERDDNLLRLADGERAPAGTERADTRAISTLGGSVAARLGRQTARAALELADHRHAANPGFDHVAHRASFGLDAEAAGRLSGTLHLDHAGGLVAFDDLDDLDAPAAGSAGRRVVQRTERGGLTLRRGAALSVELGLHARRTRWDGAALGAWQLTQRQIGTGLRWAPHEQAHLSLHARAGSGRGSDGPLPPTTTAPRFTLHAVEVDARWSAGAWLMEAALGHEQLRLEGPLAAPAALSEGARRTDGGATARLGLRRDRGSAVRLGLALERHQGLRSLDAAGAGPAVLRDTRRVEHALRARLELAASAKLGLDATLRLGSVDLERDADAARGSERTARLGLGLRWQPLRSIDTRCEAVRERRRGAGELGSSLGATGLGCTLGFTLS